MAITDGLVVEEIIPEILSQINQINLLIKGLGIFTVLWIVYSVVLFILERKKMRRIERIEEKIDRILAKKK